MQSSSEDQSQKYLLQGNEAIVEGALAAGCRFFAGYPITPSSEIAEIMSRKLPTLGGTFIQMEDEIASMGAIVGASLAGAKSLTATSGPGFSLMQENLGYASMTEVPLVVVNVMRGGPSTGLPTSPSQADVMQARWGTHGDHAIIVLAVSSVADSYEITIQAFNLQRNIGPLSFCFPMRLSAIQERLFHCLPMNLFPFLIGLNQVCRRNGICPMRITAAAFHPWQILVLATVIM